ncbi:hypothetical protein N9414_02681 [Nodularia spumigena CCY9414]|nr:hypothetical protein N9414_02681 [Nodularia spumigena CCY9414]
MEMLNKDGCEAEDLEVVADLPVDLRLILLCLPSRLRK